MSDSLLLPPGPKVAAAGRPNGPESLSRFAPIDFSPSPGPAIWLACKFFGILAFGLHHPRLAALIFFAPDPWMFWQIAIPSSAGLGKVFTRFSTPRREVWLTIDDGPNPDSTPQILDLLDRYTARATFFVIGRNVEKFPQLAREIVDRGHSLANHTGTHPGKSFWIAGPRRNRAEIDACARAFNRAEAAALPFFRPPVGLKNVWMHRALAERGLDCVGWSARGFDRIVNLDTAIRRIAEKIKPGAIVLLHDGDGTSVRVVEGVLENLQRQSYACVIPPREALK